MRVSRVAFCWGIVGSVQAGRCLSQAVDLTHPWAGGGWERSRKVWGGEEGSGCGSADAGGGVMLWVPGREIGASVAGGDDS